MSDFPGRERDRTAQILAVAREARRLAEHPDVDRGPFLARKAVLVAEVEVES